MNPGTIPGRVFIQGLLKPIMIKTIVVTPQTMEAMNSVLTGRDIDVKPFTGLILSQ